MASRIFKPVYTRKRDHGDIMHVLEKWIKVDGGWIKRVLLLMSDGCVLWKVVKGEDNWPLARKGRGTASRHYQCKKVLVRNNEAHTNNKYKWDQLYIYEHKKEGYHEKATK